MGASCPPFIVNITMVRISSLESPLPLWPFPPADISYKVAKARISLSSLAPELKIDEN